MRHKTALGRQLDMAALIAKNEKVRAVGNMGVNARGDHIDSMGRIIKPATQRVNDNYSKTVGNKSAQVKSGPVRQREKLEPVFKEELTEYEKELQDDLEQEEVEIEKMKGKTRKTYE